MMAITPAKKIPANNKKLELFVPKVVDEEAKATVNNPLDFKRPPVLPGPYRNPPKEK